MIMRTRAERRLLARKEYQARRERALAEGLCYLCLKPLGEGEAGRCTACREKARKRYEERYEYRKLSGACVRCGRIAREGKVLCEACFARQSAAQKEARHGG